VARDLYCYLMTIRNVIVTVTMTRTLVRKIRNWVLFVPDFNIHGLVAISFPRPHVPSRGSQARGTRLALLSLDYEHTR
jgi:hypothetical protein